MRSDARDAVGARRARIASSLWKARLRLVVFIPLGMASLVLGARAKVAAGVMDDTPLRVLIGIAVVPGLAVWLAVAVIGRAGGWRRRAGAGTLHPTATCTGQMISVDDRSPPGPPAIEPVFISPSPAAVAVHSAMDLAVVRLEVSRESFRDAPTFRHRALRGTFVEVVVPGGMRYLYLSARGLNRLRSVTSEVA